MKTASMISLRKSILTIATLLTIAVSVQGQENSRTLEQTYQFDKRGDAKIEFDFKLAKLPWEQWKAMYGEHPDLLLRMTTHDMAAAVIEDFSLERDDVHRHAVSKFTARALAQYNGNNQFAIPVPKNMKLVAGSGQEWVFTNSALEGNGIVNITSRAKLPAEAQNAHLVSGNDFNRLVYTLEVSPSKPKVFLYLGILLLLAAIVLGGLSFLGPKSAPPPLPA